MTSIDNLNLTIQLTQQAHQDARKFAAQQSTPEKVKQVYLNTLAVFAVCNFLEWMKIPIDLTEADSWNSIIRRFNNVADLAIPDLGKLECRPVLPHETVINLPPEVTEDRIGYIAVQFQEQLNEVQLLGFVTALELNNERNQIFIAELQPIENLIDYLDRLESGQEFLQSDDEVAVRMRERLIDQSLAEIIAQIERIYRTYDREEWRYAGGDVLASCVMTDERELLDDSQRVEVQDLAEELLEKLDEIWGDDAPTAPELDISVARDTQNLSNTNALLSEPISETVGKAIANLSQWFQSILDAGWETFDFLVNSQENLGLRLATATRSSRNQSDQTVNSVKAGKFINLGGENAENIVVLINDIQLETDQQTRDILLQVHPTGKDPYLPKGLQLIVLDESGDIFLEAQARSHDNWIQLNFRGQPGERFSVKVALGDRSFTEDFVI